MRRGLRTTGLTLTAVALTIGLTTATDAVGATPAATTWTVKPGGAITGTARATRLVDSTSSATLTCASSDLGGSLMSGKDLKGAGIGTVTSTTFTNCTIDGMTLAVDSGAVAWPVSAISYDKVTGVTKGTITGIHVSVSSSVCSFVVDGTSETADNGSVKVNYTNSTTTLKVSSKGSTLHIYDVSGCFGLVNNGDAAYVSGSYKIAPAQTIKSP